jgi:hypothetical protein
MNDTTQAPMQEDATVVMQEVTLNFRKDNLGFKRPAISFKVPRPSVEGLVNILEKGGAELELVFDSILATQQAQLRSLVNELIEAGQNITAEAIDIAKLSWEYLASMPAKERASSVPVKEAFDAFVVDYVSVMPAATSKPEEKVKLAAKIFAGKCAAVKTNKPMLAILQGQLDIWFTSTSRADDLQDVYTYLAGRIVDLLAADEVMTADAL